MALFVCTGVVAWLLARDARREIGRSPASWIVLIWTIIGASRPVSNWFVHDSESQDSGDTYDSGNSFERNIYLALILAGLCALWRRRIDLGLFFRFNKTFLLLTLFWGLSVFWADSSLIAFKRWFRDCGTIIMV